MLTLSIIWCVIGALFGIPRAIARYRQEIALSKNLKDEQGWKEIGVAVFEAFLEQLKWTLLGIISGISHIAWMLIGLVLAKKKELKKPNALGAFGTSVLIFVLGVHALERPDSD